MGLRNTYVAPDLNKRLSKTLFKVASLQKQIVFYLGHDRVAQPVEQLTFNQ